MKAKAKKKTFNIIMVALIALIVLCGIMAVGNLKGWFGGNDDSQATNGKTTNTVNVEEKAEKDKQAKTLEQEALAEVSGDSNTGGNSPDSATARVMTCTIQIQCKSILSHMDKLKEGKDRYVPSGGTILRSSKIEFTKGESAYDVTKRACNAAGIQLEAAYTPAYGGYYVEGINHLYEFDCGQSSGWMYKINGWAPNYGCSEYSLKNGDSIVWYYTCTGN